MEASAFAEYLEQHPLPHDFSRRFRTVAAIAQFVMHPDNCDAGYVWWRSSATLCHNYSDLQWRAAFKMVTRHSVEVRAMLGVEPVDSPLLLFQRVTSYMNTFLLPKVDQE